MSEVAPNEMEAVVKTEAAAAAAAAAANKASEVEDGSEATATIREEVRLSLGFS